MATPNMNLALPTPTVTLGPAWAVQLNTALELIDTHDHSTGKGIKVTPAGLNINADLALGSNNLNAARSLRLITNASALVTPQDVRSVYSVNGDLYYNNASGTPVQITTGSTLASVPSGASIGYGLTLTTTDLNINPSDTFSFILANTISNPITVSLPAANAVSGGRYFFIKDQYGTSSSNAITITPNGANKIDNSIGDIVLDSDFAAIQLISNGTDGWAIYKVNAVVNTFEVTSVAANKTVNASDTYVVLACNTGSAITVSLPAASAVATGRFFTIKDTTGTAATNNITLDPDGSDTIEALAANRALSSNFGSWTIVSDGVSNWFFV